MTNVKNVLALLTLFAFCNEGTPYIVNFTVHNPRQYRLLNGGITQINLTDIHVDRFTNRIVKRGVNTNSQTVQLNVSTHEILYKILSPNYKWEYLYDLHLDNNNSQICGSSDHWQFGNRKSTCEISLPNLVSLTLSNFTNCEVLLDRIINCLQISQIQTIKFNSNIDDDSIQQFQELIRKHYSSLKEIYLSGLLLTTINIFEIRANYTLRNVSAVHLKPRLGDSVAVAKNVINDRFCSIFPNLVKLGIKQAVIDLDQLFKLQSCTQIKYLKAVIHLGTANLERLLQLHWKLQFPVLENLAIKLVFDKCPAPRIFEQLTNNMSHMKNYILCSNCNLTAKRKMKCTQGFKRAL